MLITGLPNVFIPSLIWHAGATAEAIRTMAASCLRSVLMTSPGIDLFCSANLLREMVDKLLPLLISLLEDASYQSRQIAVECLLLLKESCCNKEVWYIEDFITIYPGIQIYLKNVYNLLQLRINLRVIARI
ncbi:hypothetical protein NQ314_015858 [Rhamnusium bicolor]|uniref:Uncharacterized protein n=1 Tax=Rhamnusium bicolor TaxID=1586634 RepID=A0AAV8WX39_9CUCU|nr:hypothetical protein NQ314_015858 [Rhamnusium bicolor]